MVATVLDTLIIYFQDSRKLNYIFFDIYELYEILRKEKYMKDDCDLFWHISVFS